jgi:hypothetical protein
MSLFRQLWFLLPALFLVSTNCFSLQRRRFSGIWKLVADCLPFEQDIRSKLLGLVNEDEQGNDYDIILKLNPDGTFKQCNEGYREGRWISGKWELVEDTHLILGFNRQYYGPSFDVLLQGEEFSTEGKLNINGTVEKGKFIYPINHPSFFEHSLTSKEILGLFQLQQVIATNSVQKIQIEENETESQFQKSDFHGHNFFMTVELTIPKNIKNREREILNLPFDIRSMPIEFYRNSTFQAWGINKILRGQFRITKNDELIFEVSFFGVGHSNPGSIYSEGIGLTQDDKRSYHGSIQKRDGKLCVEGVATIGSDLGSDARPEPCGKFYLTQVEEGMLSLGDSEEEDDVSLDSVFE